MNVLDIYKQVLPRTNCGDCGLATCLAFASAVVVEGRDLGDCPHIPPDELARHRTTLAARQTDGKGVKRDLAGDALKWARQRATSMDLDEMPERIQGTLRQGPDGPVLVLPYFSGRVHIGRSGIHHPDGAELNVWERVLIYNHMAQGGRSAPTGRWIGLEELPGSTSKVKSLDGVAEAPLARHFGGRMDDLASRARELGGVDVGREHPSSDMALTFRPLPRVPILLLFWDGDADEGFDARAKVLYDGTVADHLDIESIVFLTERLAQLLMGQP